MEHVLAILEQEGRSLKWLARRTGFSHDHVRHLACGDRPVSPVFRRRCAEALGLPENLIFAPEVAIAETA